MIIIVVLSFASLSVGFLLVGIACVKEAFTPRPSTNEETRRAFRDALTASRS